MYTKFTFNYLINSRRRKDLYNLVMRVASFSLHVIFFQRNNVKKESMHNFIQRASLQLFHQIPTPCSIYPVACWNLFCRCQRTLSKRPLSAFVGMEKNICRIGKLSARWRGLSFWWEDLFRNRTVYQRRGQCSIVAGLRAFRWLGTDLHTSRLMPNQSILLWQNVKVHWFSHHESV